MQFLSLYFSSWFLGLKIETCILALKVMTLIEYYNFKEPKYLDLETNFIKKIKLVYCRWIK